MSLREAARVARTSHKRLAEIERGTSFTTGQSTRPSEALVRRLAQALGLSETLLLAIAGYGQAEALALADDQRDLLMYYDSLPADRKRLAIATLRTFAMESSAAYTEGGRQAPDTTPDLTPPDEG